MISEKTGVSEAVAKTALKTVITFIKGKLPPEIAGQIDGLIAGGEFDISKLTSGLNAGDALKGLGNMFGK